MPIERKKDQRGEPADTVQERAEATLEELWSRDGLDRKLRACAVLGMLIAQGQSNEIDYHTRVLLANGLTPEEIEEILQTAVPYCGIPAVNTVKAAMRKALTERDH